MTLNEFSYNIAMSLGVDDMPDTVEQIKDLIINYRATVAKEHYQKHGQIPDQLTQDLKCLTLTKSDVAECCDTSVEIGCDVWKTAELPVPIVWDIPQTFEFVGTLSKGITYRSGFSYIKLEEVPDLKYLKYAKGPWYAYNNKKVYVFSENKIKLINIRGVFEDPRVAANFINCSGDPCYSDDDEFPMPRRMFNQIEDILVAKKARLVPLFKEQQPEINE